MPANIMNDNVLHESILSHWTVYARNCVECIELARQLNYEQDKRIKNIVPIGKKTTQNLHEAPHSKTIILWKRPGRKYRRAFWPKV